MAEQPAVGASFKVPLLTVAALLLFCSSSEMMNRVLTIIKDDLQISDSSSEVEIDINTLQPVTLRNLQKLVNHPYSIAMLADPLNPSLITLARVGGLQDRRSDNEMRVLATFEMKKFPLAHGATLQHLHLTWKDQGRGNIKGEMHAGVSRKVKVSAPAYVNSKVKKQFPDGNYYSGRASSYDAVNGLYTVDYEDGDHENLTEEEVMSILVEKPAPSKKRSSSSSQVPTTKKPKPPPVPDSSVTVGGASATEISKDFGGERCLGGECCLQNIT